MLLRGYLANGERQAALRGTDLGGTSAPAFTLYDHNGVEVSLASLQGHPVVLTFMSTRCASDCPVATKLHTAMQSLGGKAENVGWVAVSTDPVADTAANAQSFVRKYQLGGMRYLLGDEARLMPVWQAYHVPVELDASTAPASAGGGSAFQAVGLYLIDGQGRERVYLDSNFAPGMLEGDLRALL
ncbi:MAG TPA: SCO family protein [Ktedonobacterales bacterium]|nr:SCO family protein [Ktedonobacterales bacterium]